MAADEIRTHSDWAVAGRGGPWRAVVEEYHGDGLVLDRLLHPPVNLSNLPSMVEPLKLHGVGKRYGVRNPWVLRGVDLELAPGSLTKVEGANGSGKSTLLALIASIGRPSRGRVTGGGRRAYVPERLPTLLPYDVTEYLDRLGAVHGLTAGEARRRAEYWLERLGASPWARAPMATLSTGTAQKVALAQALMAGSDLLVLDEPWTGLDSGARAVLDDALHERVATGTTVVYVGHQHTARFDATAELLLIRASSVQRGPRRASPATPTPDLIEIQFDDGLERRIVQVPAATSDDALRQVLAEPRHHVRSVRAVSAGR